MSGEPSASPPRQFVFGPFAFDEMSGELHKHGIRVRLEGQPLQILAALVRQPGQVVSREEFQQRIWKGGTFVDFDHGLNTAMNRLRQVLGDSADQPRYIETLPGRGYRFVAPIEALRKPILVMSSPTIAGGAAEPVSAVPGIGQERIGIEEEGSPGAFKTDVSAPTSSPRRRALVWAAAVAVLAIVAAIGWWTAWRSTRPVDHPLLRLNVDLGPDAVGGGNITAAISPDGTRLVFRAHGPDNKQQLATRLLDQPQATLLSGTEGADDPFFSPDGEWIGFFAEGKMKKVSVRGSAVITLCDARGGRGAAWGDDGNIIATLDFDTGIGLSRIPDKGGTPQALTNPGEKGEATHRWPQILPGGQAVLFMAHNIATAFDDASLEVLSLKTGHVKVVQRGGYFGRYLPGGYLVYIHQRTLFGVPFDLDRLEVRGTPAPLQEDVAGNPNTGGGQFDFSRNGTFVYLSGKSSTGTWTIAWLDSAGKTQPLLAAPGLYYEPRLSPDGKRLAFSSGKDIEIYDWGREARTRLTHASQATNFDPVWTPDGKHIIFQSQATSNYSLQWIRADGAGEAQPLFESKNFLEPYSLSPDGKRLAFMERDPLTGSDLWTLPLDTSNPEHPKPGKPELFLGTPFAAHEPAFSPDGRWIAYASDESGRDEVFVRPFPTGALAGSVKWVISTGGGRTPIWSRDGRGLFYEGPDNRIMAAAYTAQGDSFVPRKPLPWSNKQLGHIGPQGWDLDLRRTESDLWSRFREPIWRANRRVQFRLPSC